MKQPRDEWPPRANSRRRGNRRSAARVQQHTFAFSMPAPELLDEAFPQHIDFRSGAECRFKQRNLESWAFNVGGVRRRRSGNGAAGPLYRSLSKQRIDAEAFRAYAKLDEQSDDLRRHALDPRRLLR